VSSPSEARLSVFKTPAWKRELISSDWHSSLRFGFLLFPPPSIIFVHKHSLVWCNINYANEKRLEEIIKQYKYRPTAYIGSKRVSRVALPRLKPIHSELESEIITSWTTENSGRGVWTPLHIGEVTGSIPGLRIDRQKAPISWSF
jgi:hypothetical protein